MAMVPCSKCNHQISDKAVACPICGQEVGKGMESPKESGVCLECGEVLEAGIAFCSSCGCPVLTEGEASMAVSPEAERRKKTSVFALALVAIILMTGFVVSKDYQKKQAITQYEDDMFLMTEMMLTHCINAEEMGVLTMDVWSNAMFKKRDPDTDQYTLKDGAVFYADFNDALEALYEDEEIFEEITYLRGAQDDIVQRREAMVVPPMYKEADVAFEEYYIAYMDFMDIALSPRGTWISFVEEYINADTAFVKGYRVMERESSYLAGLEKVE